TFLGGCVWRYPGDFKRCGRSFYEPSLLGVGAMNREEELLKKRLLDLANLADRRGIATFSDFLNLNELNIFHGLQRELSFIQCRPFGGYESAERQMVAFLPDALSYNYHYPITALKISPLQKK